MLMVFLSNLEKDMVNLGLVQHWGICKRTSKTLIFGTWNQWMWGVRNFALYPILTLKSPEFKNTKRILWFIPHPKLSGHRSLNENLEPFIRLGSLMYNLHRSCIFLPILGGWNPAPVHPPKPGGVQEHPETIFQLSWANNIQLRFATAGWLENVTQIFLPNCGEKIVIYLK